MKEQESEIKLKFILKEIEKIVPKARQSIEEEKRILRDKMENLEMNIKKSEKTWNS